MISEPEISTDNLTYTYRDGTIDKDKCYRYRIDIVDEDGRRVLFETHWIRVPALQFALYQNYPNPFNPSTTIRYSLPVAHNVSLKI